MILIDLPATRSHRGGQGFKSPQLHRVLAGQVAYGLPLGLSFPDSCPILGAIWEPILFWAPPCSARRASRTGTIECVASWARSRSEAAQRSCNATLSLARMASLTWL